MVPVLPRSRTHQGPRRPKKAPDFSGAVVQDGEPRLALPERGLAVAALVGGLVGGARVIVAVGQALQRLAAAEKEFVGRRIPNRPAAGVLVELQECAALPDRDDVL